MSVALREFFLLRPDVVFLNHGSFGACPRPVFEAYQRWQRELEGQPVEFLGRRFPGLMAEARRALAEYVGADPDDLVYVSNATMGINIAARSLPLAPGDEVLSTDQEYGAAERTWRFLCERRGARFIQAEIPVPAASHEHVTDTLWAQVSPRTRVLFISHVTSPSALILPVVELVRRARAAGIISVIDGAHAVGQIPLNLDTLGADARAGLLALGAGPALSPDGPAWYAQMVSVPLPLSDGEGAQRRLREDFAIEVPIVAWRQMQLLRVSVQGYNTKSDIEALFAATARILEARAQGSPTAPRRVSGPRAESSCHGVLRCDCPRARRHGQRRRRASGRPRAARDRVRPPSPRA